MRALAICILMHCIAPEPAAADDRVEAVRLLAATREAEPRIMAAVETLDAFELDGRSLELHRAVAEPGSREVLLSEALRPCLNAPTSLAVLAGGLSKMSSGEANTRLLMVVRGDYQRWLSQITACEAALGDPRKRELVLAVH